ncbi:hypothetical protein JTB14_028244 [Gonioctena quinquepunctata]|nr:hypothetical protein JTB14_028244 [Gonioctena quinquepunctata]
MNTVSLEGHAQVSESATELIVEYDEENESAEFDFDLENISTGPVVNDVPTGPILTDAKINSQISLSHINCKRDEVIKIV